MRDALSSLPPSHISFVTVEEEKENTKEESTKNSIRNSVRVALEHVHSVSQSMNQQEQGMESKYDLGGCPFKTLVPSPNDRPITFVSAMEEFSLAAIMANKVSEDETKESNEDVAVHVTFPTPTTPTPPPPPQRSMQQRRSSSVSHALQTGTAESHSAAESVHFVKEFIKGNISKELYSHLIWNLYHVYQTLEECLDQVAPNVFPTVYFPTELNRTAALEEDVEFFHGSQVPTAISPATKEYQDRLAHICQSEPLLLLAHAYTRYLGDLSGGKVLARVAKRALSLAGGGSTRDGLAFYHFESIPSAKVFKDHYRTCLDSLSLSEEQVERLVAEANVAFVLNMRVFEELDVRAGIAGAKVRPVEEATKFFEQCVEKQEERRRLGKSVSLEEEGEGVLEEEEEVKCPFAALGGPNPHGSKKDATSPTVPTIREASKEKEMSHSKGGRCPWPFVFCHDPQQGMRDYQTWVVIGLLSCWIWSKMTV